MNNALMERSGSGNFENIDELIQLTAELPERFRLGRHRSWSDPRSPPFRCTRTPFTLAFTLRIMSTFTPLHSDTAENR